MHYISLFHCMLSSSDSLEVHDLSTTLPPHDHYGNVRSCQNHQLLPTGEFSKIRSKGNYKYCTMNGLTDSAVVTFLLTKKGYNDGTNLYRIF